MSNDFSVNSPIKNWDYPLFCQYLRTVFYKYYSTWILSVYNEKVPPFLKEGTQYHYNFKT
jgi:hypothetical protein